MKTASILDQHKILLGANSEITIRNFGREGGSVSEVGSSSTNFEIQDGNVTFEYISFSISDYARKYNFQKMKSNIVLSIVDTGNYQQLWHVIGGK